MEQLDLNAPGARSRPHGGKKKKKKKKKKILITHVLAYVFVTLIILQSQFSKRGFKKTKTYTGHQYRVFSLLTLTQSFV